MKKHDFDSIPDIDTLLERVSRNRLYCRNYGITVEDVIRIAVLDGVKYLNLTGEDLDVFNPSGKVSCTIPYAGVMLDKDNLPELLKHQCKYLKIIVPSDIKEKYPRSDFVTNTKPRIKDGVTLGVCGIKYLR